MIIITMIESQRKLNTMKTTNTHILSKIAYYKYQELNDTRI